jgi:hypothetical protein
MVGACATRPSLVSVDVPAPDAVSPAAGLRVAAGLVFLEGLALMAAGAWLLVQTVAGSPDSLGTALFLALLAVAVGVAVAWLSRLLLRGQRWARSPVVVVQLLALPVGAGLVQGARYPYAVVDLALAVVVLGLLVTPAARAPFEPPRAEGARSSVSRPRGR